MNPYAFRRQHLKLVRLPISPPPHEVNPISIAKAQGAKQDAGGGGIHAGQASGGHLLSDGCGPAAAAAIFARSRFSASALRYLQSRRMKTEV